MNISRSTNAILEQNEIEAIKMNQEIIKRMADNSQKIKNIFLAICAAVATLFGSKVITISPQIFSLLSLMVVVFWVMDAKYLQLERQFRKHHEAIVNGTIGYLEMWDFNPARYQKDWLFKIMCSFSLLPYPVSLLIMLFLFF